MSTPTVTQPPGTRPGAGRDARSSALAGLAAGLLGLGLAQLVSALTGAGSSPVLAVSATFVDHTPLWLKDQAVSWFGTADKSVLLAGAVLVVLALMALAGLAGRRDVRRAGWAALALAAVAALAAATRPDAGVLAVVPSVVAGVVGAPVLQALLRRLTPAPDAATGRALDRRGFLRLAAASAAGGLLAGVTGWLATRGSRAVAQARASLRLPAPAVPEPPLPADADLAAVRGISGVAPFRVPNADFYRIDTALVVPQVDPAGWQLRIHGMVDREVTLSYAQLLAADLVEHDLTLTCVSNEVGGDLIGNARWLGLPIAGLLQQAGPRAGADMVLSTSADGWTAGTPLEALTDGRNSLLAVGMNGAPLPLEHGYPVRMVVPGLYGYVSATKWVVDLEVTRFDRAQGYWTPRGWSARGPVKTESRIDVPAGGSVPAGTVAVAGVAWAQHRGIAKVEVRVDDGGWQQATLGGVPSSDTWRQWVWRWPATPGRHTLAVRATDATGAVQTSAEAPPAPDGASGYDTVQVEVTG